MVNYPVEKGQLVSQRLGLRAKLMRERDSLYQQLVQLQDGSKFLSSIVEQAEVAQARIRLQQAKGAIAQFQADSPWTDEARKILILPEQQQFQGLEAKYQTAKGELAIAVAKLQKSQQQRSEVVTERAELLSEIRELEEQLGSVGVVRSPYAGVIQSIKWLGQVDQTLQVELTLVLGTGTK